MATATTQTFFYNIGKIAQNHWFQINSDCSSKVIRGMIQAECTAFRGVLAVSDDPPYRAILHVHIRPKRPISRQEYERLRELTADTLCHVTYDREALYVRALTAIAPLSEALPMPLQALFADMKYAVNLIA